MAIGTLRNLTGYLHQNPLEPHQVPAPELPGTLPICTGTIRNLTGYLHRNLPELYQVSAPEPSGTSPGICRALHRNPPEPQHQKLPERHQVSAPDPSRPHQVSRLLSWNPPELQPSICTGTLCAGTLNRYLHQNPPEPHQVSAPEPSETLRSLARNLVLKLHRIAPELT